MHFDYATNILKGCVSTLLIPAPFSEKNVEIPLF